MSEALYKFKITDPGNYRVYYTSRGEGGKRDLYCIQNDGSWKRDKFVFYHCSKDGEPSTPRLMPPAALFDRYELPDSLQGKAP